nr:LysM peptidoglycan-binding domain-containing protein [Cohnella mopanensis]
MEIKIKDPIEGDFIFPVNPEEVSIRREKQYETANLLSLGEIDLVQGEKIKEIAFSSFFPKNYDQSYCNYTEIPDPQVAMNRLTALLLKKRPVWLSISGTIINSLVYLSAHDSTFKGGEPGDVYFDVTFRTWRDIKVGKVGSAKGSSRPDMKPVPKVYIVKSGDTLTAIAKRELGSSSKWREIYNGNKLVIGRNPDLIKPGQKLVMP